MKELSIEEKAKAYDERLDVARNIYAAPSVKDEDKHYIEVIFPELKESEDERIRKRIIALVNAHGQGMYKDEMIAWLEKQGEQKPIDPVAIMEDYFANTPKEQQEKDWAELKHLNDIGFDIEIPFGVKDSELQEVSYYIPEGFHAEIESNRVIIKRGEQKPAWSEEDEYNHGIITTQLIGGSVGLQDREDAIKWFKSLKERVQPQQEWSEEDERNIKELLYLVEANYLSSYKPHDDRLINFLKSLRPQSQWKPSDEQMMQLGWIAKQNAHNILGKELVSLYHDLKNLKDEK